MNNKEETIIPEEPRARSIVRENLGSTTVLGGSVAIPSSKIGSPREERSEKSPIRASTDADEYECDLVREYEQSKGQCFLVLEDCGLEATILSIDNFLGTAQEKGKITAVNRKGNLCWDCQLYCGRALIRIAELARDKTLVQVHRCSGCSYGTHMMRKKLFLFLTGAEEPSLLEVARRVPLDLLERTASAMRKEFQDRCRSLLEPKQSDRSEASKQTKSDDGK